MIEILPESKAALRAAIARSIIDDEDRSSFRVHRSVFTDEAVLELERDAIFSHCWLYAAHASELPKPGTFVTRQTGGRELLLTRDRTGKINAFFNACSHRGALVCRERSGQRADGRILFQCPYHSWTYDEQGKLIGIPDKDAMTPDQMQEGKLDLVPVAQVDECWGFIFVCFDRGAMSLSNYLGETARSLEAISQYAPDSMEIVNGMQEYSIAANWKLLVENSHDSYHARYAHSTYFEYVAARDKLDPRVVQATSPAGVIREMANGNTVMEFEGAPWGRPTARWVSGWGDEAREEIAQITRDLVERLGENRAHSVGQVDRTVAIFPNLVVNDMVAATVRTFYPVRADYMSVSAWALAPKGESASSRDRRLRNFLEFLGPAGFATPDDVEILELCQKGYMNRGGGEWNDLSRGMHLPQHGINDEQQTRAFWREWRKLMTGAEKGRMPK
jgi:p-cumate 2,3-dioxygenase subunit alpha